MKKNGFTLAEVLVALAVVGVVAATTLPGLMSDSATMQIGPKLAKAASAFEQANLALLNDREADSITDAFPVIGNYQGELQRFFKVTPANGGLLAKDGVLYTINLNRVNGIPNPAQPPHMQEIGELTVDLNANNRPNLDGSDRFYFTIWNDGSLRPFGGTGWSTRRADRNISWDSNAGCQRKENVDGRSGEVGNYQYCAGHIFENNLKVLYE